VSPCHDPDRRRFSFQVWTAMSKRTLVSPLSSDFRPQPSRLFDTVN
jgi:hypothetical protein